MTKFITDVLAGVLFTFFWNKGDLNVIIQVVCFKFERACFYSMEMGDLYILKTDRVVKSTSYQPFSLVDFSKAALKKILECFEEAHSFSQMSSFFLFLQISVPGIFFEVNEIQNYVYTPK